MRAKLFFLTASLFSKRHFPVFSQLKFLTAFFTIKMAYLAWKTEVTTRKTEVTSRKNEVTSKKIEVASSFFIIENSEAC